MNIFVTTYVRGIKGPFSEEGETGFRFKSFTEWPSLRTGGGINGPVVREEEFCEGLGPKTV